MRKIYKTTVFRHRKTGNVGLGFLRERGKLGLARHLYWLSANYQNINTESECRDSSVGLTEMRRWRSNSGRLTQVEILGQRS